MPAEKLEVLLVEDNPGDQELVRTYLAASLDRPVELRCVATLDEARNAMEPDGIDLVLLDLGLPDASGLEVVGAVRRASADVPIVVLTGSTDPGTGEKALAMNAQDYLRKDELDEATLSRSVRYALQRGQLLQQFRQQLSASPDGMIVAAENGEVRFVNRCAEALLGKSPLTIDELPRAVQLARTAPMDVTLETGRRRDGGKRGADPWAARWARDARRSLPGGVRARRSDRHRPQGVGEQPHRHARGRRAGCLPREPLPVDAAERADRPAAEAHGW